ncbi:hypothetical protein BMS3Abin02_01828 [bacterium BMS3Abin02]|nr:hypothetical protein BMS3Abin02_01828 [bacterium BMS3Abin02]HDH27225.1 hypothetical protein [Actinomycetota bacterium]HDL48341.1 hypothetical protein [Actinomycetota bacterium]
MKDDSLQQALAELKAVDSDLARTAESVVEWLTAGEGVEVIDLAGLLRFAWYELPTKWSGPSGLHSRALEAAAELFDRLDLPRYAAVCRSSETAKILEAYARSSREGFKAFQVAYRRSGVDPPHLDDFAWGEVMGFEEAAARGTAEGALEEALTEGRLTPGASGWKTVAMEVTAGVLDSPHRTLPGQTHRSVILTERLDDWLRRAEGRSPNLHALRSHCVNRLLHPVPVPVDVAERMEPITWFLDSVEEKTQLTQAGYLPTAMVREAWDRFDWNLGWTDRPPHSEIEVVQLYELHRLLRRLGAVRRRGRDLHLSRLGRRMREDLEAAWRAVAAGLSDGEWPRAVAEVFTLLLLDGERRDRELEAQASAILGNVGWRTDGEPPDTRAVASTWWVTRRPLAALGGVDREGDWTSPLTRLTGFGEATLLEQIRAEATGPRSRPW